MGNEEIIFLGAGCVGKSALIAKMTYLPDVTSVLSSTYISTIISESIDVQGHKILDITGDNRYAEVVESYIPGKRHYVLMFNPCVRESFEYLANKIAAIKQNNKGMYTITLISNLYKARFHPERVVTTEEVEAFIQVYQNTGVAFQFIEMNIADANSAQQTIDCIKSQEKTLQAHEARVEAAALLAQKQASIETLRTLQGQMVVDSASYQAMETIIRILEARVEAEQPPSDNETQDIKQALNTLSYDNKAIQDSFWNIIYTALAYLGWTNLKPEEKDWQSSDDQHMFFSQGPKNKAKLVIQDVEPSLLKL